MTDHLAQIFAPLDDGYVPVTAAHLCSLKERGIPLAPLISIYEPSGFKFRVFRKNGVERIIIDV